MDFISTTGKEISFKSSDPLTWVNSFVSVRRLCSILGLGRWDSCDGKLKM